MFRNTDKIVKVVIDNYINENCERLDEFRNPINAHEVGVYAKNLENMRDNIINKSGISRNEITMVKLNKIIMDLHSLEKMMSM